MKACNYHNGFKGRLLALLVVIGIFCCTGFAIAHEVELEHYAHKNKVRVTVNGVTDYDVIRIFDYLLGQVPGILSVRQVEQLIQPNNVRSSRVVWRVIIRGGDAFHIERQLHKLMREVKLEDLDSIYEQHFYLSTKRDLAALKLIEPVYAVGADLHYSKLTHESNYKYSEREYERQQPRTIRPHHRVDTVPHLMMGSGQGFE